MDYFNLFSPSATFEQDKAEARNCNIVYFQLPV